MITLKNKELQAVLLNLSSFDKESGKMASGLLMEEMSLGAKRKIQKIHKAIYPKYQEYMKDVAELQTTLKDDKEKLQAEFEILLEEDVKIDAEPFEIKYLDDISTKNIYDFDLLEKISV